VLDIEVEPVEMEQSLEIAYRHLVRKTNIPGFRKGKAPRLVMEQYIGKEGLQTEALEHLLPQLCSQAVEEQKIEIIAPPELEILRDDPVVFRVTFSLRPKVELGDYHHIRLTPEPVEVTEEQNSKVLEQVRDQHGVWEPVEHPVDLGNLVTIDIEDKSEEKVVNSYQGRQYPVIQDSMVPLPGFMEHLVGMSRDEEREFSLSYPDDYRIKELAGKQYSFKVKLTEVKEKRLPELNDEFAKSVGEGFENLEALRNSVATSLKKAAEERARREFEQKVVDAAVELAKAEFPPILVEQEIDRLLAERKELLGGKEGLENYLRTFNKTEKEVREELRPTATKRLIQTLVLNKIAEEDKIETSTTELETEIEDMLKNSGKQGDELRKVLSTAPGRRWVEERLVIQKVVHYLVEIATRSDSGEEK
jgi:trigger factor